MAPGLRRGSGAAAGSAVRCRRPATPAPAALARSRGHRSARGRAHRRAPGVRRSSSARAPPSLLGPSDRLLTGGIADRFARRRPRRRRGQQHLRARPGGRDRRPLRQGAPRALRRISADAAAAVGDRPVAARAGRPRLHAGPGPAHASTLPATGARSASSSATRSSSRAMSSTSATGPTSSSTRRTTPGSAAGARRSTSPRRGCARPRKAFRSSARRRPGSAR